MKLSTLALICAFSLPMAVCASDSNQPSTLQMYLDYRLPIKVHDVLIMPDAVLAGALGEGLVTRDKVGGVVGNLAESWTTDAQKNTIEFKLRKARWSDGTPLTANQVIESFKEIKKSLLQDSPSWVESYSLAESKDENTIRFTLSKGTLPSSFLERMSEVMYGITKTTDGKLNLGITTGPYVLVHADESEVRLTKNRYWTFNDPQLFDEVILRRPKNPIHVGTLNEDPWPSLIQIPNFLLKKEAKEIPASHHIYRRHLDGLFALQFGGRSSLKDFRKLANYLRGKVRFSSAIELIEGAEFAQQFYPAGMGLSSNEPIPLLPISDSEVQIFRKSGIRVLYIPSRFPTQIAEILRREIEATTKAKISLIETTIQDLQRKKAERTADLILTGLTIDTFNYDGGLSYFIDGSLPIIPSDESEITNFRQRIRAIRQLQRIQSQEVYRSLIRDAVYTGSILPLFHVSSTIIARPQIEVSGESLSSNGLSLTDIRKSK